MNIEFEIELGRLDALHERVLKAVAELNSNMRGEWIRSINPFENDWIKEIPLDPTIRRTNY